MRRFNVTLTADAYVSANVQVAALNEADAEIKAAEYAKSGGVSWQYNGVQDGTEETQDVSEECWRCNHRYGATDIEGGRCTACGTMICAVTVEPQQAQSRFVLRQLVVLRDDPNGEIFEVISINGDSIGVRGQSTGPHPECALQYEDTLLQSAPECPASPNGRHEADIKSAELQWDGDGLYIDVHCGICGASGCAGKITAFDEVQW